MRDHRLALFALIAVPLAAVACGSGGPGIATSTSTGAGTGGTGNSGPGATSTSAGSGGTISSSSGTMSTSSGSGGHGGASTGSVSSSTGSGMSSTTSSGMSSSSGAGGMASSSGAGGSVTFSSGCNGATTALTGVVLAPNGADPIPRVRVYAAISINPYPASYCDKCSAPIDPAYVSTMSAADGSFTLPLDNVPKSASIDFAIQIGRFRKHTLLPVTPCQTATVPAADRTLPGNSTAGDIPNIAVSSGNVDHLDSVLTTLGITQYTCYEGRKTAGSSTATCAQVAGTNIAAVLANAAELDAYHMAFLSCAPGAYNYYTTTGGVSAATITANTQSWVAGGGRLFVTDTAYDYIAQAFPTDITWAGPGGSPQPVDGADVGCAPPGPNNSSAHAVAYPVKIDDMTLAAWLKVVGFASSPNVTVQGFYQPWAAISALPATTSLIADGTMPIDPTFSSTMCATPTMTDVPLTTEFDVPTCGRVIFSSYHTYTGTGASAAAANQKIMEFLIFGAAVCHG